MKLKFTHVLPALIIAAVMAAGCGNNKGTNPTPIPSGTFNGEFRLLVRNHGATKIDTTKSNIQIVLDPNGTFQVLGDTVTIHAGSRGQYAVQYPNIAFSDATVTSGQVLHKVHLGGIYTYSYDGSNVFRMVQNSSDTLSFQYDLKKAN